MSANLRDFTLIDHQNNLSSLGTDHVNKTKNEAFHDDKKVHQSVGQKSVDRARSLDGSALTIFMLFFN
ncbi:MAG: hypothetical protein ACRCYZ_04625, partial [Alphaproteobacteria bacterium]